MCVCAGAAACGPLSDRCLDRAVMSAVALGLLACLLTFWLPVAHSASLGLVLGLAGTAITIPKVSLPLLARSELLPLQFMGTTGAVVDVVAEFGKETRLFAPFVHKMIILPRQARNKHRESTQKRVASFVGGTCSGAIIGHALGHHIAGEKPSPQAWMRVLGMFGTAATGALVKRTLATPHS